MAKKTKKRLPVFSKVNPYRSFKKLSMTPQSGGGISDDLSKLREAEDAAEAKRKMAEATLADARTRRREAHGLIYKHIFEEERHRKEGAGAAAAAAFAAARAASVASDTARIREAEAEAALADATHAAAAAKAERIRAARGAVDSAMTVAAGWEAPWAEAMEAVEAVRVVAAAAAAREAVDSA